MVNKTGHIILILAITACSMGNLDKPKEIDPWPFGTTYEIFVQSFADSNGDGIGDINGMTAKLDYLDALGIQAIWLMPIHPSPSYHKYDVTDYYQVHPDYGTTEDFKNFVDEAHKRNIRVIIDLVVNHTSWEHPWFREAAKGPDNEFRDFYVWAKIEDVKEDIAKKETTLDSDNITQWHPWENSDEYYYGFFYEGMPDLNFDNPKVRQEIIAVGQYWLKEFNVDGLRLDAAKHIYPDERAEDTHAWWQEFGDAMRSTKPEVYLVGEVWGTPETIAPYMEGLHSMFNFDLYHDLNNIVIDEKNNKLVKNLIAARKTYLNKEKSFIDAIFVNNHDVSRLISEVEDNTKKAALAFAILQTLPGMPYLYYGDEIGMLGAKPDEYIREPFLWAEEGKAVEQTTWLDAKNSTYKNVIPLSLQLKDSASTYAFYKYWIEVRNANDMLRKGDIKPLKLDPALLGYSRSYNSKKLQVIHNLTGTTQRLEVAKMGLTEIFASQNQGVVLNKEFLILPAYSSVILR